MSSSLAFAMLRLHQHQARNLDQHHRQQHVFLTFLGGDVTVEQYARELDLTLQSDLRPRSAGQLTGRMRQG